MLYQIELTTFCSCHVSRVALRQGEFAIHHRGGFVGWVLPMSMRVVVPVLIALAIMLCACPPAGPAEGEGEPSEGEGEGDAGSEGEGDAGGEGEGEEGEGEIPAIEFACGRQEVISLFQCGPDNLYVSGVYYTDPPAADGSCEVTINLDNGNNAVADSTAEALAELDCKGDCVWRADIAAQFIYCGRRNEFIRYVDDRGLCEDLYSYPPQDGETFQDAIVTDPDQWAADHPCPDEDGQ
jgi:hypothetical protein